MREKTLTLNTFFPPRHMEKFLERFPTAKCQEVAFLEQLFRCFSDKFHDLFIQAIKYERVSGAIRQREEQKNQSSSDIDTLELWRRKKANKIHWVVSNSLANPDSINGWTWRTAKVTKALSRRRSPYFRDLWSQHIVTHFQGWQREDEERHKDFSVHVCGRDFRALSWLSRGDYYVLDWKNPH